MDVVKTIHKMGETIKTRTWQIRWDWVFIKVSIQGPN